MSDNIDDSGIHPTFSYRCRLLNALLQESAAEPEAKPADLEGILLDSDPYLIALTKTDKR